MLRSTTDVVTRVQVGEDRVAVERRDKDVEENISEGVGLNA
jgi:hypothetical protein